MPRPRQQVSIFSLAKDLGVSAPTISKALSNSNEVSEQLRERVRARAAELGFSPTRPRKRVFNLCVLLDLEFLPGFRISGYTEAVMQGIYQFCNEQGLEFSLLAHPTERLESLQLTKELYARNADAAVVIGCSQDRKYFADLERNRFPFVCVYDGPEGRTVTVDNVEAGRLALDHLYELGHRKLAIARMAVRRSAPLNRFIGFVQQAELRGLSPEAIVELVPEDPRASYEWGRKTLRTWLAEGRPWSALFCLAENVALGVLSEAALQRVRIPEELAVLTCDDLLTSTRAAPPLSVVDIPNVEAGRLAAQWAWSLLKGAEEARPAQLKVPRVIPRASTGAAGRTA